MSSSDGGDFQPLGLGRAGCDESRGKILGKGLMNHISGQPTAHDKRQKSGKTIKLARTGTYISVALDVAYQGEVFVTVAEV